MSLAKNKSPASAHAGNRTAAASANRRSYKRVKVALDGAICLQENQIELIKTADISEGGICISHDNPLPLVEGNNIKLQLEGVLYSGPQRAMDIFSMKVIYTTAQVTGLEFTRKNA